MNQTRNESYSISAFNDFKSLIIKNKIFLSLDSLLIFVCGPKSNPKHPNARDKLMEYAEKYFDFAHFFMAEDFFETLKEDDTYDLLTLENELTKYSDCIIIVLKSESTFSELGAFAIRDKLAKRMLVVNDKQFVDRDSFISLGPLKKIDKKSKFKPVIYTNLKSILKEVHKIKNRLLSTIQRKHRTSMEINNNLEPKFKMYFVFDLIYTFQPISRNEVLSIYNNFINKKNNSISTEISLLQTLGLIKEFEDLFISTKKQKKPFFNYSFHKYNKIKAMIVNHYHKYNKKVKMKIFQEKLR